VDTHLKCRMLPPIDSRYQTITTSGRTYSAQPHTALDVLDVDAQVLEANGWTNMGPTGTTAQRPTGTLGVWTATRGARYYDTTIGKLIMHDGMTWRDPATGAAV
jgi:hypothetical protein